MRRSERHAEKARVKPVLATEHHGGGLGRAKKLDLAIATGKIQLQT
jgi:hypothetical protein